MDRDGSRKPEGVRAAKGEGAKGFWEDGFFSRRGAETQIETRKGLGMDMG